MNKRIRPVLFFIFLLLAQAASVPLHAAEAGEGMPVTLDDAVRIGLEKSRALEIARLDRQMAGQKIRETWSQVLPQISADFTYTRTLQPSVLLLPPSTLFPSGQLEISADNAGIANINVNQSIFNLAALAGIRAANVVRRMSDEAYRNAEAGVVTDIKTAYFDALISRDQLRLIEQSIARWEESQKDTRAMFRQGIAADIDTLKAFLSVENLRPDLIQAQNRVSITMTKLKNAMGISPDSSIVLTGKLEVLPSSYPSDIVSAYSEALVSRPDLRQIELQVKAEGEQVNAARAEHFPVLSAFGKWQTQTAFNDDTALEDSLWPVSSSVGLKVSLPIFTGFGISSRVQQAKIAQLQTRTRFEDLRANIRAEMEIRLSNFTESRKRIEVQSKTISVAERSYRISLLRFREGIGSRLELTDAELQLNKAKTNYLQAIYDYLVASVQFDRSLGRTAAHAPRAK
ncbi:MAG: TolC family protein [Chlorobiaceae bacterium]|nr:TolC family protein [Chlorobiaceae bacterium]NTV61332.1 TolC family protein [Chlorobiaceae bacterium]